MKKLLLLSFAVFSTTVFSQNSIQLKWVENNKVLLPNEVISLNTSAAQNIKANLDIKNTSNSTQSYNVIRYDVSLNTDAIAYYCFAGTCYGDQVFISPTPITLTMTQSSSDLAGSYNVLTADLDEGPATGPSIIKYTFINTVNASDSMQISIHYNPTPYNMFNANFGFAGITTSSGLTDPSPSPAISGISLGQFSAAGTSANPSNAGVFSFSGWPLGATDGNDTPSSMTGNLSSSTYYNITVNPAVSYYVSLSSIHFNVDRSSTGPRYFSVRSSMDGFAANLSASTGTNSNLTVQASNTIFWNADATTGSQSGSKIDLSDIAFKNMNAPVSFRFYAWNSEDANGTFGIDNVVINGHSSLMITGIATVSQDLNSLIKLYPNPSSDGIVNLDARINFSKIEVSNSMGKLVSQMNAEGAADQKASLDLSTLPTGVYFVKLYTKAGVSTEKLIISK